MKTTIIVIGFLVLTFGQIFSQIKFEGEIDSRYRTIQLEDGSFKYLKYNQKEKKIVIFNLDNTLWRSIILPLPKSHLLDEIKHISQYTFNKDEELELVYTCIVYEISDDLEDPDNDNLRVYFTLNIVKETGEHLLKVHDSNEMKIINSKGHNKLLIYKHHGTQFNSNDKTLVYTF